MHISPSTDARFFLTIAAPNFQFLVDHNLVGTSLNQATRFDFGPVPLDSWFHIAIAVDGD